jgi:Fe-S oxidoreductase
MATYKAEFLSHYYHGRTRPRHAYAYGWIDRWASVASRMPGAVNWLTQTRLSSSLAKAMAGMASERSIPLLAQQTFTRWFQHRPARGEAERSVMLWPDTFNNHFHPEIARAAVEVLEAAGYGVRIPRQRLCCGRPLYDFGMLEQAQRYLRRILTVLRPEIDAGMEFVVLEPACAAVFRDELVNLFPGDEVAKRLCKQTYFFSEFIDQRLDDFEVAPLARKALVHAHCHQKAIIAPQSGASALGRLGLDFDILDSGCCGMAGSFGFEKNKYPVSRQIGELVLLPAVRAAAEETLIITDGFSCREQITQCTARAPLHLAQVLHMAMRSASSQPSS